jgi:hypothetical protein
LLDITTFTGVLSENKFIIQTSTKGHYQKAQFDITYQYRIKEHM